MKVKRLLVILLSLVLLIGSVFAVGISADETAAPEFEIVSKNVAYDGDMKLLVAVPKASFDDDITLTIEWTENTGSARGVETVTTAEALRADGIADPTINGVECYAVMAGRGVSAKDTGTELTITIRATKDGAEVTYSEKYSVLQYVYAKLYENEILYAEEGTPNAARRALYLSTIKFAKYAEKVLYDNLNTDTSDDLEIHADEWIYSDLEGTPKLYKPGDKITLNGYTKLLQYTLNGSTVEAVKTFASGEVTLSAAVSLLENPDKTETFDQGIVDTDYITPNGGSVTVDTVDGNKVLVSTSEAGSIKVHISDRVYDRDNVNDTYVFNADFHLDAGEKIGDITFHDAEGNVVYTLSLDTATATYYYPEAKQSAIVTAAFAEAGWHTLEVELYQNNRVKVYVDGACYLGYVDGNARGKDISALSYATLSLANAKYDNVGFAVCDKTFSETNFAIDFENGNVQDTFGKLVASGAAFSLASDLADKADTALKVAISGSEAANSTLTLDLTNEDPQGSLYVFEMDIKGTSYTNTGDRALMTLTFGDDANNQFNLYNKYGSGNNYGKGMGFGLGGRNILTDVYTYNASTDTSYVLTYNEWYTLRLELDLGATPEVRVLVKSSATGNVMTQVASITTDGTTVTVPGATRTPATKLNTAALVDVDSVNLSFNKVNASNTYIDNLSFTRTTNEADGETKCDHSTMGDWENVVAASCNVFGEDVRRCACGNAACDYVETRQLDKLQHSEGVVVPRKDPTCISTGYEAYIGCPNCFEVTEGEFIVLDKIPHNLVGVGAIVDNKQTLQCTAGECGNVFENWLVASAGNGVLNFTDYAITERVSGDNTYYDFDDGKVYVAGMSSATLDASAPSVGNPYVTYSVTGDGALKVQTVVANYSTYKGPALYVKTTNTNPSGTKYALDFDIYAEHSMTDNTSRVLTQLVFGGNVISLMTYGTNVCIYGASSKVLGAANEWISVRVEYTVTSDENGTAELIVKDKDGLYRTVHTATLSGSAIKVAGVSSVYISSYSTNMDHTYYLDNISLIRVDTNCYHMDGEDYRVESWTQTKAPTCTTLGEKQGICTECGETVTVEIPMIDHTVVTDEAVAPTCTTTGLTEGSHCSECNTVLVEQQVVDALGHNMGEWIIDSDANCTDNGAKHKECSRCDYTETAVIYAHHTFGEWTDAADTNYEQRACTECKRYELREKYSVVESVDLSSAYTLNYTDKLHGSSIATGGRYNVLELSFLLGTGNDSDTNIFKAHFYDDGNNGVTSFNVKSNANTIYVGGTALDTTKFVADSENGTWVTMRIVQQLPAEDTAASPHNFKIFVKLRDSEDNWQLVTSVNGISTNYGRPNRGHKVVLSDLGSGLDYTVEDASFIRTTDANYYYGDCEHVLSAWETTVAPTCTTDGTATRTCTVDGCEHVETVYIPATGHNASDWITDSEAGCVTEGSKHKECTVCGEVLETETIEPTGDHDIGGWTEVDGGYKKGCANCDTCDEYTETISGGVVHFNDGTILSGDKITVTLPGVEITGSDADKAATSFTNNNISLSIVNDTKAQVNNVLKVVIDPAQKTGTDATIDVKLADEAVADGNLLVFEMEFKNSTYTNSGGAYLFNIKIGNNNFYVYPKYNTGRNYGAGLNFGIGGRNILYSSTGFDSYDVLDENDAVTAEAKADTSAVLPYNEWITLRLELNVDAAELKTYVKSSKTDNVMQHVATTDTTGTTASIETKNGETVIAANNESTAKLDVTGLADLTSVQIQINDAVAGSGTAATTNYLDNLSFNILDTRCYHTNISDTDWNVTAQPGCTTEGEKQAECPDCHETIVETIEALGHELVDVEGKDATCTEPGYTAHKACSRCDYTEGYEVIEALDHTEGEWIVSIPVGCFTDGEHYKVCTVCGEELAREAIVATGHSFGAWTDTDDATIEKRSCDVCGRYQLREKDYAINFENGAILDNNGKLSVTFGMPTAHKTTVDGKAYAWSLDKATGNYYYKVDGASSNTIVTTHWYNAEDGYCYDVAEDGTKTKTDHYIPTLSAGASSVNNSSLNLSLADDVSGKVLKLIQTRDTTYGSATIKLYHTDATRSNADKYVVAEFDLKANMGTNSTRNLFAFTLTDSGNNQIYQTIFQAYNGNLKVDNSYMIDDAGADGETWYTIRIVSTLATEKQDGTNYVSTHNVYAKARDAEGPMTLVRSYSKTSTYTGNTERSGGYLATITEGTGENHTFFLDNISLIRTSDANYTYSACDHAFDEWNISAPDCDTDGVATRSCTNDGCGYTEREYIPALGHELSDWTDAEGNTQVRTCANCDYVISRAKNENAVQFDDGTLLDGGKVTITLIQDVVDGETVDVVIDADDTEGGNPYVWYSVVAAPDRLGETALKVHTVKANYVDPYKGPRINLTPMNEGATGNVYTLDFDMYVEMAEVINSSRVLTQIAFGGHTLSLMTYGSNICLYGSSATVFGAKDTWIGFRAVYTVTADKAADVEILVKDANGAYQSKYTTSITDDSIKLAGTSMYFSSYSSGMDHTYYLDNIYLTRKSCDHVVDVWNTTVQPTCTVEGEKQGTCTLCGEAVVESVEALGHELADVDGQDATCTEPGYTDYKACSRCDYIEGKEVIDALGHTEVAIEAVAPDCTNTGLTEGVKCSVCDEILVAQQPVDALGHTDGEWITDVDATCTAEGSKHQVCAVCGETIANGTIAIIAHTFGAWADAEDTNYEERKCSVCDRIQRREKNAVIDFSNNAIIDNNNKLSVTVGALTTAGTEAGASAPTAITSGMASGGNGRLQISVEEAVLKLVSEADHAANYGDTKINVKYTDALHEITSSENGGRYVVFDFDVKFAAGPETATTVLKPYIYDKASSGNWIGYFEIKVAGEQITAGKALDTTKYKADGETWMTFRLVTELDNDGVNDSGNYVATTKLYVKLQGADGPMEYLTAVSRSSTYTAHVEDSDGYCAVIHTSNCTVDQTMFLDNLSLIRTTDSSYFNAECDHVMGDWSETEATCTEEGVVTRSCTAGCGYVETEYIPALGHKIVYSDPIDNKCTVSCTNGCGYVLENWIVVPNTNTPVDFEDGKITSGGKLSVTNMTAPTVNTDTEVANSFITYSIAAAPSLSGNTAIKIATLVENFASRGARLNVALTSDNSEGSVYTLDFDIYPQMAKTDNTTRVLTQVVFGGGTFSLATYGTQLRVYGTSIQIGSQDTWSTIRLVFTITSDTHVDGEGNTVAGTANVEVLVKDTEGKYASVHTAALSGTGIKLSGVSSVYFSSYSTDMDHTYYLDNISYCRVDTSCQHAELGAWEQTLAPTCTTAGEKSAVCQKCGETVTEAIDALGHTEEALEAVAPDCINTGLTEGVKCSKCQEILEEQQIVATTDHAFGDWTVSADGNYDIRTCDVCQHYQLNEKNNVISSIDTSTLGTTYGLQYTDMLHEVTAGKTGGKYIVLDFDALLGTTQSSLNVLTVTHRDDAPNGNNTLGSFSIFVNGNTASVTSDANTIPVTIDGETYISFRLVIELAEVLTNNKYVAKYTVYAKESSSSNYVAIYSYTYGQNNYTGHVGDSGNYFVQIKSNNPSAVTELKNVSLIRTSDANYAYCTCTHVLAPGYTLESVDCLSYNTYAKYCTVEGCGYAERIYLDNDGHQLSGWTDVANTATQIRECQRDGCGYSITRDKLSENAVQFDDGTILDGGKVSISEIVTTVGGENDPEASKIDATSTKGGNKYNMYEVVDAPGRLGDNALKVVLNQAYLNTDNSALRNTMNIGSAVGDLGNVYNFDFDLWAKSVITSNSSSIQFQLNFCGSQISIMTYGAKVSVYGNSGVNLGAVETWLSLRAQYVVTADGSATINIQTKGADGSYTTQYTTTATNSAFKLDGITNVVSLSHYSQYNCEYYLDNISFTRTAE